jgi:hypothetical protein
VHERIETEREQRDPVPVIEPARHAATAEAIQALQRTAGNQAVARWVAAGAVLARDGTPSPTATAAPAAREDHVFLMGDPAADEFYREARGYYRQRYAKATIHEVGSLAEVLAAVKGAKAPIGHLVIVSHAHEDGTLMFKLDANDPDNRLEYGELKEANAATKPDVDAKIVDEKTSIEIRGCNIGRSPLMLNQIDMAFGGKAKVTAPKHEQHYSHDQSGTYTEDFSGYFIEEPGIQKKSAADLQKLFAAKYPFVDAKDWPKLLASKTMKVFHDRQGPYGHDVLMPEPGDAVRVFGPALDGQLPKADGWKYRLLKRTAKGDGFEYEFEASRLNNGSPEKQTATIPADPPATADLEKQARADLSRPDAYDYKTLKTSYDAKTGTKKFDLFAERTEWRIRHTVIKDASGPHRPAAGDKEYWGESTYTP